jgi:F0F1-type ATP synthase assembly protein I
MASWQRAGCVDVREAGVIRGAPMRLKSRFAGFVVGAVVGELVTVYVYTVFVIACFIIREPKGLDDLDPFVFGGYAALIVGPIFGGVLGMRRVRRSARYEIQTPATESKSYH